MPETKDVRVFGGPRDGADLTYREVCFLLARGMLTGYVLMELKTAHSFEEYLLLRHESWFHSEGRVPDA